MKKVISFFSKIISKIHMPFNHKRMTEDECIAIIGIVKPGDILLSHTRGELSNIALDHWGHGAIFSKEGLYEAVTSGVKKTDLMFFLSRKDDVLILRNKGMINDETLQKHCSSSIGISYDYGFETGSERLYCFEFCADAIMSCSSVKISQVRTPLGKQYLAKSFLIKDFEVVWQK